MIRTALPCLIAMGFSAAAAQEWTGVIPGTSQSVYVPDRTKPIRAFINGGRNVPEWRAFAQRWNCAITDPEGNAEDAASEVQAVQAKLDGLAAALNRPECPWLPLIATGLSASSALANDLLRRWDNLHPGRCIASVQYHELDRVEEFPRYLPPVGVPHLVVAASGDGFYAPGPMAYAASDLLKNHSRPLTLCYQPKTGHAELGDPAFVMRWLERMMERRLPATPALNAGAVVPIAAESVSTGWRGTYDIDLAAGDTTGWSYVGKLGNFYPYLLPAGYAPFGLGIDGLRVTNGALRLGDPRIATVGNVQPADGHTWLLDQAMAEAWLSYANDATIQPIQPAGSPPALTPGLHRQFWSGSGPTTWDGLWTTSASSVSAVTGIAELPGDALGWYRWVGWFNAPSSGGYAFRLIGDGGLSINGRRVITGNTSTGDGAVLLAAGWHRFCLAFRYSDNGDPVEFFWRAPQGGTDYVAVPADRFARAASGIEVANTAPVVTAPPAVQMPVNPAHISRLVWCYDRESVPTALMLSAASSSTALVPNNAISISGSGGERRVTVRPAANQSGTATITLTVSDGALSGQSSFTVTIGTGGTPPDTTPPAAPAGLTATVMP